MAYRDFMNKVRYWDNILSRWLMRHIYFIFFEAILVVIFIVWFIKMFSIIDTTVQAQSGGLIERMMSLQTTNMAIITLLMLMNSFWMLYMFNSVQRLRAILKDMNYHIGKLRSNRGKGHMAD
jgi:magnesium-transporting ATPase (P-type)